MKTIVYQSYRGDETPKWLENCMQTVKYWAELKGFHYQREDDFFECVPDWYKDKVAGKINVIADLARLELAKKFLDQGYERTIWMDRVHWATQSYLHKYIFGWCQKNL